MPKPMDIAPKKLDPMRRLMQIWDEGALQRVAKVIETEVPDVDEYDDLSEEEISELDAEHARVSKGEGESYTIDQAMDLVRKAAQR